MKMHVNEQSRKKAEDGDIKTYKRVLEQLKSLVNKYRMNYKEATKERNVTADIDFVKQVVRDFANPQKFRKFEIVEIRKPGKPLRLKRSSIDCLDDDCKAQKTEEDFQKLEEEANALMQELEAEYGQVQENLMAIDKKILESNV